MWGSTIEEYTLRAFNNKNIRSSYEFNDEWDAREFILNNDALLDDDFEKTAWEIWYIQSQMDIIYELKRNR